MTNHIQTTKKQPNQKGYPNNPNRKPGKKRKKRTRKVFVILGIELFILALMFGGFRYYIYWQENQEELLAEEKKTVHTDNRTPDNSKKEKLTPQEQAAIEEQERLLMEMKEREELIAKAEQMTLSHDYDGAIELLKSYQGNEGGYKVYTALEKAVERIEAEKASLKLYGGSYSSASEINHLFFHTLIAEPSRAFDGDYDSKGYNMYMITVMEFEKILQSLYDQGYVLIRMSDLARQVTLEDGTTKYIANEIYLREGKKPIILSEDDVSFYDYMQDDGFATRIVLDEEGKPTCEMVLADGTKATGPFDIIPILDDFVEKHPDFSYKGAKGLLALTGYEGILGYRTNDPTSPTYAEDVETVKKIVEVLKADGWEFGSHSWGHLNMQDASLETLKKDTNRWLEEVGSLVGPTDVYVFPYGFDIETGSGTYKGAKYHFLKESGFNIFLGVYKEPWLHIKKDYVRMTRRPIDGQAMLEFPERLKDLFNIEEIIDPRRPEKNW